MDKKSLEILIRISVWVKPDYNKEKIWVFHKF